MVKVSHRQRYSSQGKGRSRVDGTVIPLASLNRYPAPLNCDPRQVDAWPVPIVVIGDFMCPPKIPSNNFNAVPSFSTAGNTGPSASIVRGASPIPRINELRDAVQPLGTSITQQGGTVGPSVIDNAAWLERNRDQLPDDLQAEYDRLREAMFDLRTVAGADIETFERRRVASGESTSSTRSTASQSFEKFKWKKMSAQLPPPEAPQRYQADQITDARLLGRGGRGTATLLAIAVPNDMNLPEHAAFKSSEIDGEDEREAHGGLQYFGIPDAIQFLGNGTINRKDGVLYEYIPSVTSTAYFEHLRQQLRAKKINAAEFDATLRHCLCILLRTVAKGNLNGVVHEDIKPDNILISAKDGRPKLNDFSTVTAVGERTPLTTIPFMCGGALKEGKASPLHDSFAVERTVMTWLKGETNGAGQDLGMQLYRGVKNEEARAAVEDTLFIGLPQRQESDSPQITRDAVTARRTAVMAQYRGSDTCLAQTKKWRDEMPRELATYFNTHPLVEVKYTDLLCCLSLASEPHRFSAEEGAYFPLFDDLEKMKQTTETVKQHLIEIEMLNAAAASEAGDWESDPD
ncbi:MAG: hypothetical protein H7315_18460 [Herminiimonas sp.]|nr:hypothetical protein [Herminiimonas sp.]